MPRTRVETKAEAERMSFALWICCRRGPPQRHAYGVVPDGGALGEG